MMATPNTPAGARPVFARLRSGLLITGQALLLIICAALAYAWIWVAAILMEPTAAPETRHFPTAIESEGYHRTQHDWGDS